MTKGQAILLDQIEAGTGEIRDVLDSWNQRALRDEFHKEWSALFLAQIELLLDLESIS